MSSFESPDHGHTHIGRIGFVSQDGKSTKQALWSVAKPELANTKGQGCYCQPKKRHPHQKTRNSKPNHKRSLDSNQNSVRAHQKQGGSLGNITVSNVLKGCPSKTEKKGKKQRKKDMASHIITLEQLHRLVSVSSTHLLSAGIKAGGSITMAGSRRHGEESWLRGGFGASTTQYNK